MVLADVMLECKRHKHRGSAAKEQNKDRVKNLRSANEIDSNMALHGDSTNQAIVVTNLRNIHETTYFDRVEEAKRTCMRMML